jgi:RNA polymerase sigma factor (sigma-70 family)
MNSSTPSPVSTDYIRDQLIITQSHSDPDVRTRARNALLMAVMPELLRICRGMLRRFGPSEDEMMSEAVAGAIDCIRLVDTSNAERFLAYLHKKTRFQLADLFAMSSESRPLPVHAARRVRKIADEYCDQTSIELLSDREIAARCCLRKGSVKALKPFVPDQTARESGVCLPAEEVQDETLNGSVQCFEKADTLRVLARIISTEIGRLTERQRQVLGMSFPLDGRLPMSQTEISAELGLSYQRVQRIIAASLYRLRLAICKDKRLCGELGLEAD